MIRRPPRSTRVRSSAASDVYKRQEKGKTCIIHTIPEDADLLRAFVERVQYAARTPLSYRNEGLPATTYRILIALLKAKRVRPTTAEQKELLAKQNHCCAECREYLHTYECEYDHILPLCRTIGPQTFQILCEACHLSKTWAQQGPVENPLASVFTKETYEKYVKSPWPRAVVFEAHEPKEGTMLLDIIRCRANCLKEAPWDFPVFSPRLRRGSGARKDVRFDVC